MGERAKAAEVIHGRWDEGDMFVIVSFHNMCVVGVLVVEVPLNLLQKLERWAKLIASSWAEPGGQLSWCAVWVVKVTSIVMFAALAYVGVLRWSDKSTGKSRGELGEDEV
jgi:hypothetical protein